MLEHRSNDFQTKCALMCQTLPYSSKTLGISLISPAAMVQGAWCLMFTVCIITTKRAASTHVFLNKNLLKRDSLSGPKVCRYNLDTPCIMIQIKASYLQSAHYNWIWKSNDKQSAPGNKWVASNCQWKSYILHIYLNISGKKCILFLISALKDNICILCYN